MCICERNTLRGTDLAPVLFGLIIFVTVVLSLLVLLSVSRKLFVVLLVVRHNCYWVRTGCRETRSFLNKGEGLKILGFKGKLLSLGRREGSNSNQEWVLDGEIQKWR